jgi:phosphatidylinositol glycan class B
MPGLRRARSFLRSEAEATGWPLGSILRAAVAVHVIVAVLAVNPWHPDEHFQILEFAWARAGLSPLADLPWEFPARIRPTLQPSLAMVLLELLRALGISSPFPWMLLLRLGTLAAAAGVVLWTFSRVSPGLDRRSRRVLWLAGPLVWFAPLFMFRFSSENLAGIALVAALPLLEKDRCGRHSDVWAGALLGLSFVFRFQMGFAIGALLLWLAVHRPRGLRRAANVGLSAAGVVMAAAGLDSWFYGAWVFTPWRYFEVNLLQGTASSFGTSPWYAYLLWAPLWMAPPLGLAIAGLVAIGCATRRHSPWTWAFVAFLVGHSLIAHKEVRFLLPMLYFVPVLAAWGFHALSRSRPLVGWARIAAWGLVAQSCCLSLLLLTPAVYRGREVDAHYLRWLWEVAERQPGDTIYVLQDEGSPYLGFGSEIHVYRHPRIRGVPYHPGEALPEDVPPDTPPERLLLLVRGRAQPTVPGARLELAYTAEAGYRVMARWAGLEDLGLLRWIEGVDGWTRSQRTRQVYRIRVNRPDGNGMR